MGRIVHFEIPADNADRLVEFYKKTFGWNITKWGDIDYWMVDTIRLTDSSNFSGINGAITKRQEPVQTVVNTIEIDDIHQTISAINQNGGKVISEIMDIPDVGKVAYFKDPDGNTFGIIQGIK
ncbi:MAG: VOC family protein [Bacteroidota bacterium]|nr:VOC family protein [Bacteroidota bacterium]